VILYNYDFSNYSEKIRLLLGYKGVSWKSVEVPSHGPKPDFTHLTGGYRRAPVLQIGADVYCDTRLIAEVLESLFPNPTIYPGGCEARTKAQCETIIYWVENSLMRPLALYVTGLYANKFPLAFHLDRAKLHGKAPPSLEKVRQSAKTYFPQVKAQLHWIEGLLSSGQNYILSDSLSLADLAVYQCPWFIQKIVGDLSLLDDMPKLLQWTARVSEIGWGDSSSMTSQVALDLARVSSPLALTSSPSYEMSEEINIGEMVEVSPFGEDSSTYGWLVYADESRLIIRNAATDLGDVFVHFPRLGYRVRARQVGDFR
jgi:glutathione S-transferase